jgi:hypothetical protein
MNMKKISICAVLIIYFFGSALAGEADVVAVEVKKTGDQTFRFDVTVQHDDQGWDHYTDGWEILSPEGEVLGKRVLAHPHTNEQPFTRSLSGVRIPPDIKKVTVRAHDSMHAFGGESMVIELN